MYEIKSCDFIYQHIKKHHIPQKYDSFLDLLSKNCLLYTSDAADD